VIMEVLRGREKLPRGQDRPEVIMIDCSGDK
jgi:hypothetical protein